MPPDTQAQLREELSKALKDAKFMFDDGLIDQKEYGDLKSHELAKYKAAVAALPTTPAPSRARTAPRSTAKSKAGQPSARTQATAIQDGNFPAEPEAQGQESPPPAQAMTPERGDASQVPQLPLSVEVDPDTYERLRTPPIFRRRSLAAKRTVVLEDDDADMLFQSPHR